MTYRCWLSFDLGLRGNYEELYAWLDNHQANECGDSMATFTTDKNIKEIGDEVAEIVGKNARIYLIGRDQNNKPLGRFVVGTRKQSPWTGYGANAREVETDE